MKPTRTLLHSCCLAPRPPWPTPGFAEPSSRRSPNDIELKLRTTTPACGKKGSLVRLTRDEVERVTQVLRRRRFDQDEESAHRFGVVSAVATVAASMQRHRVRNLELQAS